MHQIFTNLVSNAVKFTGPGGRITLSGRTIGDRLEFAVADTGIGIPPEHQPRLFERFYRAAKMSYGGLGLGLYITRDIVERHGGRIWADSTPGKGSTFHVVLPRIELGRLLDALH